MRRARYIAKVELSPCSVAVTKQHKILYSRCEWVYGTKIIFARLSAAGRVRPTGRLPGAAAHVASLFLRWPNFFMQMTVKLTVQTHKLSLFCSSKSPARVIFYFLGQEIFILFVSEAN
jgi:hypothetical protein